MTHVPPPLERDCAGSPCSKLLFRIKREAKILKKATGLKHSAALDQIAQKAGFSNFQDAQRKCESLHVLAAEPAQTRQRRYALPPLPGFPLNINPILNEASEICRIKPTPYSVDDQAKVTRAENLVDQYLAKSHEGRPVFTKIPAGEVEPSWVKLGCELREMVAEQQKGNHLEFGSPQPPANKDVEWRRMLRNVMRADLGPLLLVKGKFDLTEDGIKHAEFFTEDGQQVFLRPEDVQNYSYRPLRESEKCQFPSVSDLMQQVGLKRDETVGLGLPQRPYGSNSQRFISIDGKLLDITLEELSKAKPTLLLGSFEQD